MMKFKTLFVLLICVMAIVSCNKNEDDGPTAIPVRDRGEQQAVDSDSLIGYLETHYYNASAFMEPGNYSKDDIVITELPKDDDGNYLPVPNPEDKLLIDAVGNPFTMTLADVEYEYYVLNINEGGGENPDFTDDILVNYTGHLLSDDVFDSTANPIVLDLSQVIAGWPAVFPKFKTAEGSATQNDDGTLSYNNYGLGVMFLPSGLAYYAQPPAGIPIYSNLIFKFELLDSEDNDHDGDGILSQNEDLNANNNVNDDDTDGDRIPNFADSDDDGDGVPTLFEDLNNNGNWEDDDDDNDGIPNYLDIDSKVSNQ